jgi:hypothetical protein
MSNKEYKDYDFRPRRKPAFWIEALAWIAIHLPYYLFFYYSVRLITYLIEKYT